MPPRSGEPGSRIEIIDALRGSALLGILLLHSIEHWDFLRPPDATAAWLRPIDAATHQAAFFLFGGKAYGIFALVFGVSFFLILDRWSQRGIDFRSRFLWRLAVLAAFGYLHGIIYCGDILLVLAVLGIPLAFCTRLGNRAILAISILLMLQLPSAWEAARVLVAAGYHPPTPRHWAIYGELENVFASGSFWDVSAINLWRGQSARIWWTIETGRYTQMLGLFLWGLLLARSGVLTDAAGIVRLGRRALAWGLAGFAAIFPVRLLLQPWGLRGLDLDIVDNLVAAYLNIAQMAVWVGGFALLWRWARPRRPPPARTLRPDEPDQLRHPGAGQRAPVLRLRPRALSLLGRLRQRPLRRRPVRRPGGRRAPLAATFPLRPPRMAVARLHLPRLLRSAAPRRPPGRDGAGRSLIEPAWGRRPPSAAPPAPAPKRPMSTNS